MGLFALVDRAWSIEPVDSSLGADRHQQGDRVDTHTFCVQQPCLGGRVAQVRSAVADDHDVTPRVGRQNRACELQSGGEIRVVRVRPALELRELWVGANVDLQLGIAAEAHNTSPVFPVPLGQDLAHHRGLPVHSALGARRQIGEDHHGLLGRRRLKLEAGERSGQEENDHHPQSQGEACARRRQRRGQA